MSLAIEQRVCQTLETSKPTISYKLLHSVKLIIRFQQNSHRYLPTERPFMHWRTSVNNTEWESLVLPNCHMHKRRHGGFNTRKGKKGPLLRHQYIRDEVRRHAVNSIIKPLLWSHREWRNDIYHNKKKKDCFRISGASLIDEMDSWPKGNDVLSMLLLHGHTPKIGTHILLVFSFLLCLSCLFSQ